MKRPLATAGLAFLCVCAVFFCFGSGAALLLAAALMSLLALFVARKGKGKRRAGALICAAITLLFVLAGLFASNAAQKRREELSAMLLEKTVDLTVAVRDVRSGKSDVRIMEADGVSVGDASLSLRFKSPVKAGDEVRCRAYIVAENTYSADAGDSVSYYASLKEEYETTSGEYPFYTAAGRLKSFVKEAVRGAVSGEGGSLAAAVFTGDKSLVSTKLRIDLQRTGTSHILVVSGLHVSFLLGLLFSLLQSAGLKRYLVFAVMLAAALGLSAVYGFTPSVIRASFMMLMSVTAPLFSRRNDPLTSLTLAAVIIVALSPRLVVSASFVLSFLCCVGILCVAPRCLERLCAARENAPDRSGFAKVMVECFVISCSITLTTLPAMAAFDMPVSLVSPFANVLVIQLMSALMTATVLLVLLCALGVLSGLVLVAGKLCSLAAGAIIAVCGLFSKIPLAAAESTAPYFKLWALFTAAVVLLFIALPKNKLKLGAALGCIAATLLAGSVSKLALTYPKPELILYYGNSAVLRQKRGCVLLLRGADSDSLLYLDSFLKMRLINSVEYVIITDNAGMTLRNEIAWLFPEAQLILASDKKNVSFGDFVVSCSSKRVEVSVFETTALLAGTKSGDYRIELSDRNGTTFVVSSEDTEKYERAVYYDYGETISVYMRGGEARVVKG